VRLNRGPRTPAPNRAQVDTSAAPDAAPQAALFVAPECWCRSLSQYKERWQRNCKAVRI
jgi:hypothetical protein